MLIEKGYSNISVLTKLYQNWLKFIKLCNGILQPLQIKSEGSFLPGEH